MQNAANQRNQTEQTSFLRDFTLSKKAYICKRKCHYFLIYLHIVYHPPHRDKSNGIVTGLRFHLAFLWFPLASLSIPLFALNPLLTTILRRTALPFKFSAYL